jgi:hypothetical protein
MGRLQERFGAWGGEGWRAGPWDVVQKLAIGSPPEKEKAALGGLHSLDQWGFFFFHPISSEYQIQH